MIHTPVKRIDWQAVKDRLKATQEAIEHSARRDETRMRQVFRQRARRLAHDQAGGEPQLERTAVLAFNIGSESYGIELRSIAQVFPDTRITPVPGTPPALLGIANLQGEVRSVLGLRRLLSLADDAGGTSHYILLLRDAQRRVGLRVNQLEGVRQVARDEVLDQDETLSAQQSGYVLGVTTDRLIILNGQRIVNYPTERNTSWSAK